jgi:hypothetical protein
LLEVCSFVLSPVEFSVIVIVAFGSTAPDESVTVPVIVPRSRCARAGAATSSASVSVPTRTARNRAALVRMEPEGTVAVIAIMKSPFASDL